MKNYEFDGEEMKTEVKKLKLEIATLKKQVFFFIKKIYDKLLIYDKFYNIYMINYTINYR